MVLAPRFLLSSVSVVLGLVGCGGAQEAPAPPDFSVPACQAPVALVAPDITCPERNCGENSPIVNGFPINGLSNHGRGTCNRSGVQLLPRSLQGGGCGSGADLALDPTEGVLIGERGGKVVCTGERLTGATFTVRSHARATLTFAITNVRRIQVAGGGTPGYREGYRIESGGASACEPGVAANVRSRLGLRAKPDPQGEEPPTADGYSFGPDDDLVVAMDGPLYDVRDALITNPHGEWFNLACAGDALAKQVLFGLYFPGDERMNETTLRMITANYCGKAYTLRGIQFGWAAMLLAQSVEAGWAGGKAVCIDKPRLMVASGIPPEKLPASLQPTGCDKTPCNKEDWIKALRTECKLGPCKDATKFDFMSFLGEPGIQLGRKKD